MATMDGYLRLGMVRSALCDASHLKNRLLLDRASYDFGRPRWHLTFNRQEFVAQSTTAVICTKATTAL